MSLFLSMLRILNYFYVLVDGLEGVDKLSFVDPAKEITGQHQCRGR